MEFSDRQRAHRPVRMKGSYAITWQWETEPDWETLSEALNYVAVERRVALCPMGYVREDSLTSVRVDLEVFERSDIGSQEEIETIFSGIVGTSVQVRPLSLSVDHPEDLAALRRAQLYHRNHRSILASHFEPCESLTDPEASKQPDRHRRRGRHPRSPRERDLYGGTLSMASDVDPMLLDQALEMLRGDQNISITIIEGMDTAEGERRTSQVVVECHGGPWRESRETADTKDLESLIEEYLGCEVELRELGHTMASPEDLRLLAKVDSQMQPFRGGPRRMSALVDRRQSPKRADATADELFGELIGLEAVEARLREVATYARVRTAHQGARPVMHLCFRGNPGVGKTSVARAFGRLLFEEGLIADPSKFVEADRGSLVAGYVGQTALKTEALIERARGGILFIDEAYALFGDAKGDYGYEAVASLVKAMEDQAQDLVVILAGYAKPMDEMLSMNPGLRDRVAFYIDFPDYDAATLCTIAESMATREGYALDDDAQALLHEYVGRVAAQRERDFSNGRLMRKVMERIEMRQATLHDDDLVLHADAVRSALADEDLATRARDDTRRAGF